MPIKAPDVFTRTVSFAGTLRLVVRPSLSMVFYTRGAYITVKAAVARALKGYLAMVPAGAIAAIHDEEMDPVTGSEWSRFDAAARDALFDALVNTPEDEEDFNFVLCATLDGQSGDYGFAASLINFDLAEDVDDAESVMRIDFPWNFLDGVGADAVVGIFEKVASLFPACSGHAGMSFIHTMTFMPQSGDEIANMLWRFLGFDPSHDFVALEMRGKVLTAHWLNLLDAERVGALGGMDLITLSLPACELRPVGSGLLIRSAKLPPVADNNWRAPDIGRLPDVARLIEPIRFANGLLVGLKDADAGQDWLARFDGMASRDWDNG